MFIIIICTYTDRKILYRSRGTTLDTFIDGAVSRTDNTWPHFEWVAASQIHKVSCQFRWPLRSDEVISTDVQWLEPRDGAHVRQTTLYSMWVCVWVCIYVLICSLQSWDLCSAFIARHFLCVLHIWQNSFGICKQKPNEIEIGIVGKQRQIIKLNFAFEFFARFVCSSVCCLPEIINYYCRLH